MELLGPFNNIKGINTLTKELKACSLGVGRVGDSRQACGVSSEMACGRAYHSMCMP